MQTGMQIIAFGLGRAEKVSQLQLENLIFLIDDVRLLLGKQLSGLDLVRNAVNTTIESALEAFGQLLNSILFLSTHGETRQPTSFS